MPSDEQDDRQGLSTPQKIVAGTALGVAIPAAVGVAKKLLGAGDDEEGQEEGDEPSSGERRGTGSRGTRKTSGAKAKSKSKTKASATSKSKSKSKAKAKSSSKAKSKAKAKAKSKSRSKSKASASRKRSSR